MSYHEGSNWQAKKEDEGKPLYGKEQFEKDVNRKMGKYMNPVPKYPSKDNGYNRGSGKGSFEFSGESKPPLDIIEDEFIKWLDEIIEFNKQWLFTQSDEEKQMQLLIQVKKKYLEIKNKNT